MCLRVVKSSSSVVVIEYAFLIALIAIAAAITDQHLVQG